MELNQLNQILAEMISQGQLQKELADGTKISIGRVNPAGIIPK